ncbi:MAG: T9SS type A sorting domain-containing protein [Chitinophagaceae bacterium]|nr:T9SS type A sorting domain-containing protein [Chitinophagaceae bacterium]
MNALLMGFPAVSVGIVSNSQAAGFWENKGQVTDQDGIKRSDILYVFEQDGFTIALGKDFFSYQLTTNGAALKSEETTNETKALVDSDEPVLIKPILLKYERTDVKLTGANKNVKLVASGISKDTRNYIRPSGTYYDIHHYQKITYQNIYEGIDLVFYISNEKKSNLTRLKYDFVIQPGADMRAIRLNYAGASLPVVNENGELLTLLPGKGFIKESKPLSYYEASRDSFYIPYQTLGSAVTFKAIKGNQHEVLTIDPEITWSRYFGGVKDELIEGVEADGFGNIYSCGQTLSPSGVVTTGAYQTVKQGVSDNFITKMNQSGTILWSTYFGGEAEEVAFGMCLDGFGNLYLCGQTRSLLVMSTTGAYQVTNNGLIDAYISKFDTSGVLIWSTFLGGAGKDQCYSCIADQTGVYVGGYTESATNIVTAGAQQTVYGGAGDAFISAFSPSGAILFSTYLGGSDQDRAHDVVLDHFGNLLVSGTTPSEDGIALGNVHQSELGGNNDVFVAKYKKSGVKKWCTYYGGLKTERGREIVTDGDGNSYITGPTASGLSMTTPGVYQTQLNGSGPASSTVYEDAYLAKFDTAGHLKWGTYYGGAGDEIGSAIKLLPGGLIMIGGTTDSDSLISTPDAIQPVISGKRDAFLAMFSDKGQLVWSTYYGGTEDEIFDDGYGPSLDIYDNRFLTFAISTFSPGLGTLNTYTPSNTATPTLDGLFVNIDLGCLDKYEPNNQIEKSYPLGVITQPASIDALINYAGDRDFYSFTKTSDWPVKVYLSNLAQNCDIILYDSLFHPIKISHHAGTGDEEVTLKKAMKGKVYVAVFVQANIFSNICYHLSIKKIFALTKSVDENEKVIRDIFIYPNPASNEINVTLTIAENTFIRISDITGKVVLEKPVTRADGAKQITVIDIQKLHSGTYLVTVPDSDLPVQKLIVY